MPSDDEEKPAVPEPPSAPATPDPKPGESPFEQPGMEPGKKGLDDSDDERRGA
jgi:hypothetical protein